MAEGPPISGFTLIKQGREPPTLACSATQMGPESFVILRARLPIGLTRICTTFWFLSTLKT